MERLVGLYAGSQYSRLKHENVNRSRKQGAFDKPAYLFPVVFNNDKLCVF